MKRTGSIRKKNIRLRRIFWLKFRNILIIGVLLLGLGGITYFGVDQVISIKNKASQVGENQFTLANSKGEVLGISEVPSFPESKFLFENNLESDIVQQFLAKGKSAYLLPLDADWDDVVTFYSDGLDENGWTHVLSVDRGDESKMFGEYWVKGEKGLRIYTKLDDIWYEIITVEQANSGLADKIAQEDEIDMYLAMNSGEELPTNYPWKLEFSSEWTAKIGKSKLLEIEFVQFDHSDGEQVLVIEPIEFVTLQPLRDVGVSYLDTANEFRDTEDQFKILSIDLVKIDGQEGYKFSLESDEADGFYCVVANPKNEVIYVIRTFTGSASFFNYVLSNISVNEEKKTSLTP
ncbi:MAG: hypothetical protein ABIC57_02965 [bacterium]